MRVVLMIGTLLALQVAAWAGDTGLIPGMGDQWPDFRGPLGNFQALPCAVPLIDDLKNLKRVWVSEKELPGPAHQCHKLYENLMGSPIVAEDKVFVLYFQPTGNDIDESSIDAWKQAARGETYDPANPPGYVRILAEDYLLAMDLKTGKTVWETKLPRMGQNWRNLNFGARHQLIYGDKRIFAMGSGGALYGVEAKTGKLLWETDMGPEVNAEFAACLEAARKKGLRAGHDSIKLGTTYLPAYADGVIAQGFSSRTKSGYWAMDAATGNHLWQNPGLAVSSSTDVMAFVPEGKSPVFIGVRTKGNSSVLVALEPKTGKEVWNVPFQGSVIWLARAGQRIIASGDKHLGVVEVNKNGASLLWETDCPVGTHYARPLVVGDMVVKAENQTGFVVYELGSGKQLFMDQAKGAGCLGDYVQPVANNGRLYAFGGVRDLDVAKGCPYRRAEVAVMSKAFDPSPVRYMWPVIVDGRMIAHCSTRVVCWDLRVTSR